MFSKLIDVVELSKKKCDFPIKGSLRYATRENFTGKLIDGYSKNAQDVCLLAWDAAEALCGAQNYFLSFHQLSLIIYDAYRPCRAVKRFKEWLENSSSNKNELKRKEIHYPNIEKSDLARLGYIPNSISRHSYGSAVDVFLISLDNLQEINMGCVFDYFDTIAYPTATADQIGKQAWYNRNILINGMQKFKFSVYEKEFWHFDFYKREIDCPLDIMITAKLKNLNVT